MENPYQPTEVTSDDKLWGLLSYLLTPLIPIVVLLMEDKKNRPFLKAHAAQALALGVIEVVLNTVLSFVLIGCITAVATLILNVYFALKAYRGETFSIPVITDFVRNQGWA